jgi:DNA-binding transcriptional regulator LsrR (DeoR family)
LMKQVAAFLRGQQGRDSNKQAVIAKQLGVSQATVQRYLKEAEAKGWLIVRKEFNPEGLDLAAIEDYVNRLPLHSRLQEFADSRRVTKPNSVLVFDSGSIGMSEADWERRLRQFARAAARSVAGLVSGADVCCVAWGQTIGRVAEEIETRSFRAARGRQSTRFMPMCGEFINAKHARPKDVLQFSASMIAARLNAAMGLASEDQPPSLTGVPAVIPRGLPDEVAVVRRVYASCSWTYRALFGPSQDSSETPIIERADGVLASFGSPRISGLGMTLADELIRGGVCTLSELEKLAAGDIGGVLIPKEGLDCKDSCRLAQIQESCTGVNAEMLKAIARKCANKPGCPGIVLLGIGANKACVLRSVLAQGLVNSLVIDQELAKELLRLLPRP